jgi:arylsulfatase A-like enzyme
MFTGMYAFHHGMGTNCDMYHALSAELNHPEELLHYKLLDEGYKCGYIGKWHVGTNMGPCDYGFEGQNVPGYGNCRFEKDYLKYLEDNNYSYEIKNPTYFNPGNKTLSSGIWDGCEESTTEYYLAQRTIEMMQNYKNEGAPFFLTCQFWGPHGPSFPPKSFVGTTDRSKIEPWINAQDNLEGKPNFVRRHLENFYRKPPKNWEEWREVIGMYYDFTSFIDKQIGRILENLEQLGIKDDTVVIFTSDHGETKGTHGGLIDKGFLYEEAVHIPLSIYHPSFSGDKDIKEFVYNMDIMPTVLDDLGLNAKNLNGKSLLPIIKGEKERKARKCSYIEFHGIRFLYSQRAVISEDNYKYIWTPGDFDELYDLNLDPGELNNIIDDKRYSEVKDKMIELIKECSVEYGDPLQDYAFKIFGQWENPSGKVDTTAQRI